MPVTPRTILCAICALLAGCSTVAVFDHAAAPDPGAPPARLLIQTPFDALRDQALAKGFTERATAILASCRIDSRIIHPGAAAAEPLLVGPAIASFKPDAVLTGRKTIRSTDITQHGMFLFTLHSVPQDRDLGKVTIHSFGAVNDEQLEEVGGKFARAVLRTLADDRALRTCPPIA